MALHCDHAPVSNALFVLICVVGFVQIIQGSFPRRIRDRWCASYSKVVLERQYWRLLTAPMVFIDVKHYALSLLSVQSLCRFEGMLGTSDFIRTSFILLLATQSIGLVASHKGVEGGLKVLSSGMRRTMLKKNLTENGPIGLTQFMLAWYTMAIYSPHLSDIQHIYVLGILPLTPYGAFFMFWLNSLYWTPSYEVSNLVLAAVSGVVMSPTWVLDWITPYFLFCCFQWYAFVCLLGYHTAPAPLQLADLNATQSLHEYSQESFARIGNSLLSGMQLDSTIDLEMGGSDEDSASELSTRYQRFLEELEAQLACVPSLKDGGLAFAKTVDSPEWVYELDYSESWTPLGWTYSPLAYPQPDHRVERSPNTTSLDELEAEVGHRGIEVGARTRRRRSIDV